MSFPKTSSVDAVFDRGGDYASTTYDEYARQFAGRRTQVEGGQVLSLCDQVDFRVVAANAKAVSAEVQAKPRLSIVDYKAQGLPDVAALLAALDQKLAMALAACGSEEGTVTLRLVVGKDGKVTKVEVVKGADKLGRCLSEQLKGVASSSKPSGATGTLEITVKVFGFAYSG